MGKVNLKLLVLLTIVLVVMAVLIHRKQNQASGPEFEARRPLESIEIQKIDRIGISLDADTNIELNKINDESWGLAARGNYPVDVEKLRGLVLTLTQIQFIDSLTSNPDKYERLGLGDQPETAKVVLYDEDDSELAHLIIGKERKRTTDNSTGFQPAVGHFVRLKENATVFVASERINIDSTPANWLKRGLLDVGKEDIQQIHLDAGTTESYQLIRTGVDPFEFKGEKEAGYTVKSSGLNGVTSALSGLRLDDVLSNEDPRSLEIAFDMHYRAILKNGLIYQVDSGSIDDDRYVRVASSYSQTEDLGLGDERTSDSVKAQDMGSGRDQVEELNTRLQPWIFKIPNYKYTNLAMKRSGLLEKPEEDDEDGKKADLINGLPIEGLPEGLDLNQLQLAPGALDSNKP